MSSSEFTRWIAYAEHEPFGYPMENFRFAVGHTTVANAVYSTIPVPRGKRRPKPLKPEDLYPAKKRAEVDLTPEQRAHIAKKRKRKK